MSIVWFESLSIPFKIAVSVGLFIGVICVIYIILKLFKKGRKITSPDRGRNRTPRLGIVDAFDLGDGQRQLILLRRDNVEHLLMIGGPNDTVVETNIVRVNLPKASFPSGDYPFDTHPFDRHTDYTGGRPNIEAAGRNSPTEMMPHNNQRPSIPYPNTGHHPSSSPSSVVQPLPVAPPPAPSSPQIAKNEAYLKATIASHPANESAHPFSSSKQNSSPESYNDVRHNEITHETNALNTNQALQSSLPHDILASEKNIPLSNVLPPKKGSSSPKIEPFPPSDNIKSSYAEKTSESSFMEELGDIAVNFDDFTTSIDLADFKTTQIGEFSTGKTDISPFQKDVFQPKKENGRPQAHIFADAARQLEAAFKSNPNLKTTQSSEMVEPVQVPNEMPPPVLSPSSAMPWENVQSPTSLSHPNDVKPQIPFAKPLSSQKNEELSKTFAPIQQSSTTTISEQSQPDSSSVNEQPNLLTEQNNSLHNNETSPYSEDIPSSQESSGFPSHQEGIGSLSSTPLEQNLQSQNASPKDDEEVKISDQIPTTNSINENVVKRDFEKDQINSNSEEKKETLILTGKDPFSVEEIEAEFARLLGRVTEKE